MFPHLVRKRQELDAIPVKARWLDRFVWESLHFPDAAISGSAYRGGWFPRWNICCCWLSWVDIFYVMSWLQLAWGAVKWRVKCATEKPGTEHPLRFGQELSSFLFLWKYSWQWTPEQSLKGYWLSSSSSTRGGFSRGAWWSSKENVYNPQPLFIHLVEEGKPACSRAATNELHEF